MANYFKNLSLKEQTKVIAQYLPDDPLYCGKNIVGHPLYKVLNGIAPSFIDVQDYFNSLCSELDPNKANELLSSWERFLGIPDDCIPLQETVRGRRNAILLKFAGMQFTVTERFQYVLDVLGIEGVTITNGGSTQLFSLQLPYYFLSGGGKFTIFVTFPDGVINTFSLKFPIQFTTTPLDFIKCLFSKLKPAHTKITYAFNEEPDSNITLFSAEGQLLEAEGDLVGVFG